MQLVVVSPPAGTSTTMRHVAFPQSQPAELVSPNSLEAVMRTMNEAAPIHGTREPTLDEIEIEYQHVLAPRCAAGLQFPSLTIVATLPIILHAMSVSGLTQQTMAVD